MLTEKGIRLTPIIMEFSLWGDSNMREFNQLDIIDELKADQSVIIKTIQDNYKSMLVKFR